MKKKVTLILILYLCSNSILFGCTRQEGIDDTKFNVLFQNNEKIFSAVVNDLWPLELDGLSFYMQDGVVEATDGNDNKFEISDECRTDLLNCLQKMQEFLDNYYNLSKFSASIHMRQLYGNKMVIEFNFHDAKNKIDSAVVYTTEQLDGDNYVQLKEDWYRYAYGLV